MSPNKEGLAVVLTHTPASSEIHPTVDHIRARPALIMNTRLPLTTQETVTVEGVLGPSIPNPGLQNPVMQPLKQKTGMFQYLLAHLIVRRWLDA